MALYKISPTFSFPVIDVEATSKNLKFLREERKIKVSELQKMFNLEYPQAIYNWENPDAKTLPRIDNLVALAKLYEITIDELLVIKMENSGEMVVSEPSPPFGVKKETIDFIHANASKQTISAIEKFFGFSCYNPHMEKSSYTVVKHPLEPVWSPESTVLLLGTMPSPASREVGFYYMHPQNRFWRVLPAIFGERLSLPNNSPDTTSAIAERKDFILRHNLSLWDVLASCQIEGAADSSIKQEIPNDFTEIFSNSKICRVFFTGKTAAALWKKHCSSYEKQFGLTCTCLPSTSPANARFTMEKLIEEYKIVRDFEK